MPLSHATHAERLIALTRARFDAVLHDIEVQSIRHSCRYEDPPDWTARSSDIEVGAFEDSTDDLTGRPFPGWRGPELRPALVRWLITDPEATALLEPRGLRIWNARFTEPLDLRGCRTPVRLEFRYCLFVEGINLNSAETLGLYFVKTTLLKGIEGERLKVRGPLFLKEVVVQGLICLDQAIIEAEIAMEATTCMQTPRAVSLANAVIKTNVLLSPSFRSLGSLYLDGVRIGGSLVVNNAEIESIHMVDSKVEGQLQGKGATLTASEDALTLDQSTIGGSVILRDGFRSCGRLSLRGADIGGSLECDKAIFTTTRLALSLDNARVRGSIFLRDNFQCAGKVNMHGAEIGGQVNCSGAKFTNDGDALGLEAVTVKGHVLLYENFECLGKIRLTGAKIGGQVSCDGSYIRLFEGENMDVAGDFFWRGVKNPGGSTLNLTGAKVRFFRDDQNSWPNAENLKVNGLLAQDLRPLSASNRISWLNRQPKSQLDEPQPWMHLAGLLTAKGQKRAAKRVILELRKHQSRANWKDRRYKWIGQSWELLFARLEEQPLRILITVMLCVVLGSAFFWPMQAHFAPTSEIAYKSAYKPGDLPIAYPKFQPIVYALENVLPVVKLGQDDRWAPDARHSSFALYWSLMLMRWFLIVAGYVQGGILAAAVSARFRD